MFIWCEALVKFLRSKKLTKVNSYNSYIVFWPSLATRRLKNPKTTYYTKRPHNTHIFIHFLYNYARLVPAT